jgi:hypothetical protein
MDKSDILVCKHCGSQNVETSAWVKVNENDKCNGYVGLEASENNWCCDCEEHVLLISLAEWEESLNNEE